MCRPKSLSIARSLAAVLLALLFVVISTGTASAAPPCLNYESDQEGGKVTVDLRQDPTGAQTVLTIFWFIKGDAAGSYSFQNVVNGRPVGGRQFQVKDDNLHTAFRMIENNGQTINWHFGDTYHFDATHFAPAENITYVTPVNECVIVAR
jgi:hypothetical protein